MYELFRALFSALWSAIRGEVVNSKSAGDAKEDKSKLRAAGKNIRDYIRLRGGDPDKL